MLNRLFSRLLQSVIITSTVYLTMYMSQAPAQQPLDLLNFLLPSKLLQHETVESFPHWPI